MEGDRHFSHPHPLASFLVDKEMDFTDNDHSCKICGLPTLSAPSYTCTFAACDFFLHESCASKFREQLIHPNHDSRSILEGRLFVDKHTLCLREGSPNFTYECECEECDFEMHPMSAAAVFGVEIKTEHKSHPPHPLVAHCRKILSLCDACGERHDGFFFSCQHCDFWIHQDCTILPTALVLPFSRDPYVLFYSIPDIIRPYDCIVCYQPLLLTRNAIYICPQTMNFSHVRCGLEKIQSRTRLELIQLPDDESDTFPSLEIRTYSQADNIGDGDKKLAIENFHKHPLIVVGDGDEEDHSNYKKILVCDICMQTIAIPSRFYRCAQQSGGCSFLAHKACADLLPIIKLEILNVDGSEVFKAQPCPYPAKWFFSSIFFCFVCCLPTNAACYYFPVDGSPDDFVPKTVDLSCMAAPSIIKHSSHSQHLLYRTTRISLASPITCCSRGSILFDVYKCTICDFLIHIRCALLPKRVRFHKFDQHPLHLITSGTSNSTGSDHDICEVCEEGIELKYWFYQCAKCDYSFHVNCIPSLGYLSKVKFGGKCSMSCHSHPLKLKRMLTVGRNEKCGYCNQIVPGLVDQAAFSCSHCDYWIHFSCARDSFTSSQNCSSFVFKEIDEQTLYDLYKTLD